VENYISSPNNLSVDPWLDDEIDHSDEPLVVQLKNANRLERLRTTLRVNTTITMLTSPLARILRRDWNLVSAKLFVNALDKDYEQLIRQEVSELAWQAADLHDLASALPVSQTEAAWMRPRTLHIQIVHPITAQWLRAFVVYDRAFAKLINAEKAGRMTKQQRLAMIRPCQLSYMGFKAIAMKMCLKSTEELLAEAGF